MCQINDAAMQQRHRYVTTHQNEQGGKRRKQTLRLIARNTFITLLLHLINDLF